MQNKVNILMATYNGSAFIDAQIQSIVGQSYHNWKLYIRDDNSADETPQQLQKWCNLDSRITVIKDSKGNVGSCLNFSLLMTAVKDEEGYIMFSDQDDVWLSNKIELEVNEMVQLEAKYSKTPLLVYTNFSYVDELLQPIKSKLNFSSTKVKQLTFSHLLAQNPIHGCTMIINNQLLKLVDHIPPVAENHDYWIALVATAFGKVVYLQQRTVLYRQHGSNISGQHNNNYFAKRFSRILLNKKNVEDVRAKLVMAEEFKRLYYNELSTKQKQVINTFLQLKNKASLRLLMLNLNNNVRRQTTLQTLLFYATFFMYKKKMRAN